jgi:hypothetical protein
MIKPISEIRKGKDQLKGDPKLIIRIIRHSAKRDRTYRSITIICCLFDTLFDPVSLINRVRAEWKHVHKGT